MNNGPYPRGKESSRSKPSIQDIHAGDYEATLQRCHEDPVLQDGRDNLGRHAQNSVCLSRRAESSERWASFRGLGRQQSRRETTPCFSYHQHTVTRLLNPKNGKDFPAHD
jgi:hypothetical protein